MAVTTEIPWGDGSSDKIYLTRNASEGNQTVLVSSDANTGAARSKVVTFSASGASPVTLTVNQAAGAVQPVFYERLRFDGTAYIDTDIVPDAEASYRVRLGNETLKAAQRLFIVPADGTNIGAILSSSTTSTRRQFGVYYGSSTAVSSNRTLDFSYATYDFFITPSRFGWGNIYYTFTKGSKTPNAGLILGANTAHTGQAYTGTMGTFEVYGSNAKSAADFAALGGYTPYRTLRPCKLGNESGMWCVETSTFYGNSAGAGSLSVEGNIVT